MSIWKGVTYDRNGKIISCLFCRICELKETARIIHSNEKFVAFLTIAPVTKYHLLISPREHISNIYGLRDEKDAHLIEEMIQFGKEILQDQAINTRFCFHVPPYNSIDHLHLHCIVNPEQMSWLNSIKYLPGTWWCSSATSVIENIRNLNSSNSSTTSS